MAAGFAARLALVALLPAQAAGEAAYARKGSATKKNKKRAPSQCLPDRDLLCILVACFESFESGMIFGPAMLFVEDFEVGAAEDFEDIA